MKDINTLIAALDRYIEVTGCGFLTPPEANEILTQQGMLPDSTHRPGLPLRRLLRSGMLPHAFKDGAFWIIPHSGQTVTKEYAAIIQLHDAVALYYAGSYLSAVTLAGAAAEILREMCDHLASEQAGEEVEHNHLTTSATFVAAALAGVGPEIDNMTEAERGSFKKLKSGFFYDHNRVRNALKHKEMDEDFISSKDFMKEAQTLIGSAIRHLCDRTKVMPTRFPLLMRFCKQYGISFG